MRFTSTIDFNPRSLWGERPFTPARSKDFLRFQSTLPVGGATRHTYTRSGNMPISIHAPCGGSDRCLKLNVIHPVAISIHAPCGGSDVWTPTQGVLVGDFNPRSLWGERLNFAQQRAIFGFISIHAPCGGSDPPCMVVYQYWANFNPRSLWGERRSAVLLSIRYH